MPSPKTPGPKKNYMKTLTQRLGALDSKFDAKHAQVEAQAEEATRAVNSLKKCASRSRTQMSVRAFEEEDLEPINGADVTSPTIYMDPQRLAEVLGDPDEPSSTSSEDLATP